MTGKVVHVQTLVQVQFGVLDDDDNLVQQQPIVAKIATFSEQAFVEAYELVKAQRDAITAASTDADSVDELSPSPTGAVARGACRSLV